MKKLRTFIADAFTKNALVKAISFALAVTLFFWVRQDRETTVTDYIPLRLVLPPNMMVVSGDPPERVRFTARGRESDLTRFDPSRLQALSVELEAGDSERPVPIPVDAIAVPSGVRVTSTVPNEIVVKIEKRETKRVPIEPRVVGEPPDPYQLGALAIKPPTIEISGPASVLKDLSNVYTESIDVTGQKTTYRKPVRIRLDDPLLNYDTNTVVTVEIPINTQEVTKTLESLAIIAANTSHNVVVNPDTIRSITIRGPKTILDQLDPQTVHVVIDLSAEDQKPPGTVYTKKPSVRGLPNNVTFVSMDPAEVLVTTSPRL